MNRLPSCGVGQTAFRGATIRAEVNHQTRPSPECGDVRHPFHFKHALPTFHVPPRVPSKLAKRPLVSCVGWLTYQASEMRGNDVASPHVPRLRRLRRYL